MKKMQVISYNKKTGGAQVVIITTLPNGKRASQTKHLSKEQMVNSANL